MYHKIASIEHLRVFTGVHNNIFYIKPNNILNSLEKSSIIELKIECNSLTQYGENLILLDENNRIITSLPDEIDFHEQIFKIEHDLIYFYRNNSPNRVYGIYTKGKIIFLSSETSGDLSFFQNFIFENRSISLKKIHLSKSILWHFNLSILGKISYEDIPDEIEKILGIAHGNVWFNTKGGRLVALDVESGEVIRKFSCYKNDQKLGYDINLKIGRNTYINDFDNHIYGMSGNYFQKINAETLEIEEEFNYFDSPDGIGKFKNHYSFLLQGNYFTFIAQKDDGIGGIRFAGLFDYRKKELVWEYEIISAEEKKAGNELIAPQPLYMSGNKLYIKDFKNTLHIFEKESEW